MITPPRSAFAAACSLLAALVCGQVFAAQTPADSLISVSIMKVKPEFVAEFEDLVKNEVIPAVKKGGLEWRHVWVRAQFGEAFEYHVVTPISKFAQYDGQSPLAKGLGEVALRNYYAKSSKYLNGIHTHAFKFLAAYSHEVALEGPANLAVVSHVTVAQGRRQEFLDFIKRELLPVVKKSDIQGYLFHEAMFGGNASTFLIVALNRNYADLDKGHAATRVLGAEGAEKLMAKLPAGVVTNHERSVYRLRTDLSLMRAPDKAKAAAQ